MILVKNLILKSIRLESAFAELKMNYPYAHQGAKEKIGYSNNARADLSFGDWMKLLMREFWLMALIFLLISALGIAFAMTMEKKYTAHARLSVLVGDEYIYSPRVGADGAGAAPKQEQIVQSEVEILGSAQLAARVISAVGLNNIFDPKDLIITQGPDTPERKFNIGVEAVKKNFSAYGSPNTTVIQMNFKNRDPNIAAQTLNRWIDEYLSYRREVLFEDRSGPIGIQKSEFSGELIAVEKEVEAFLKQMGVADFDSERVALQSLLANIRQELLNTQSRLSEAQGRFNSTNRSFAREPNQIRASFETDNSRRRLELQQQLAELQTKYTDESQPVMDMKRRIESLDALLNSADGQSAGTIRMTTNPVRDSLASEKAKTGAEVEALISREAILSAQVRQLQERSMQLSEARPQFDDLMRRKAVLEEQVRQFSTREAAARALSHMSASSNDNIRVIERAVVPTKGKSMKKFVALGAILFAGFSALVAGALRALSRTSFPTPGSVGRTLDLPVLATVTR